MDTLLKEREVMEITTKGWAATEATTVLSPYTYTLRKRAEDVVLRVICCGICHTDIHIARDDFGIATYPMVPGHEVVGEVIEVGSEVTKFSVGDTAGVGFIVGSCRDCELCNSDKEQYCANKITTYNDKHPDGSPTHGGLADAMVVHQRYLVKIPKRMAPEQAAPLLCAGITVYSPLINLELNRSGLRGGVLGLGGVGHMGVIIAKAMGHHVTVISSSDKKKDEALQQLGADEFIVSSDTARLLEAAGSLHYILDTLPVPHSFEPFLNLLKFEGKMIVLSVVSAPLQFPSVMLLLKRISIVGSFMGSVKEMEELIKFFTEKGLNSKIEVVKMDYVNTALERLQKNDVRYRFVVDVAGAPNPHP